MNFPIPGWRRLRAVLVSVAGLLLGGPVSAYVIDGPWRDNATITMQNLFAPVAFQSAAENQLAEWNFVDTHDGSHPFQVVRNSTRTFQRGDGFNVMGFLGAAGLKLQYGLDYGPAIAWNAHVFDSNGFTIECDTMLNPALLWDTSEPTIGYSFRGVVLHEQGHCRGLGHEERQLNIMFSIAYSPLQATLYTDDREGIRNRNTTVPELDIAVYNRFHSLDAGGKGLATYTSSPAGPVRPGDTVNFANVTVENRGSQAFNSVRLGIYISPDAVITNADIPIVRGTFSSFNRQTVSNAAYSGIVPEMQDCGLYYSGAMIDDFGVYSERNEVNNSTVFVDPATAQPRSFQVNLRRDALEPNDAAGNATIIPFESFLRYGLSIDSDGDNDWYYTFVPQGGDLEISLGYDHALGDIDFEVLNGQSVVVGRSVGTTGTEALALRNLPAGPYWVRVYGFGAGSCNRNYFLSTIGRTPQPDRDPVSISIADARVIEGNQGFSTLSYTVILGAPSTKTITATFATCGNGCTANATADPDEDFASVSETLTFAPGETSKNFNVRVFGDAVPEPDETVDAIITSVSSFGFLLDDTGTGTIIDDDLGPRLPTVSINDVSIVEGNSGTSSLLFTLSLSESSLQTVTVQFATVSGSATEGVDYLRRNGTVSFAPGRISRTQSITLYGDTEVEPDENFLVSLSNPVGAAIADGEGQATIVNDDSSSAPGIGVTTRSFNFGSVRVGSSSVQRMLVITSSGTAPLNITSIRLTGDFVGSSNCPRTLAPGATCTLTGNFRPTATGPRTGSVSIISNAPDSPTIVQLSGTGT